MEQHCSKKPGQRWHKRGIQTIHGPSLQVSIQSPTLISFSSLVPFLQESLLFLSLLFSSAISSEVKFYKPRFVWIGAAFDIFYKFLQKCTSWIGNAPLSNHILLDATNSLRWPALTHHASIALIILDSNPLKPSLKFLLCTHGLISSYLQTKSMVLVFHRLL